MLYGSGMLTGTQQDLGASCVGADFPQGNARTQHVPTKCLSLVRRVACGACPGAVGAPGATDGDEGAAAAVEAVLLKAWSEDVGAQGDEEELSGGRGAGWGRVGRRGGVGQGHGKGQGQGRGKEGDSIWRARLCTCAAEGCAWCAQGMAGFFLEKLELRLCAAARCARVLVYSLRGDTVVPCTAA